LFINFLIQNYRDYFPWTIFYKAFTEDVDRWHQKLEKDKIPISWNRIQKLDDMASKMEEEIAKMEDHMTKTEMSDKLNEFRQRFLKK
jgi:hypothetical protein